ncbi:MAG TPA: PepSY domain-containing protein [Micropepsaceae bacterium]|nr:PepSY domain-containing protein [Micropepsaceae bacterium]
MAKILWRATVITHRYLGVVVGLLMLVWFASGIVMMYVAYPSLTDKDRLASLGPISWEACCALDKQGFADDDPIRAVQLQSLAGEPVLRVRPEGRPGRLSSLGPSGPMLEIDESKARAVVQDAVHRIIGRSAQPVSVETIDRDQWTVGDAGQGNRPLFHFVFDDPNRTHIYVSGTTGEIVLWTTTTQRFWNWLGAIPHWLYFTQLRSNGPLWAQIVIWTSILGGFLTIIGLYLGISQFNRGSNGRISPYRGWFYWHHLAGLVFGLFTLTWVVSGTLSMNPWGFLEGGGGSERIRLAGEPLSWSVIRNSLAALKVNPPAGDVVSLQSAPFDGKMFWLAVAQNGAIERLDSQGHPAEVSNVDLGAAAKRLAGTEAIASQELIATEDAYYFDFSVAERSDPPPFPVYRIILNDAENTRYYLDPRTGELLGKIDADRRGYRWFFNGLHRLDFTAWLRMRPIWDVIMLALLLGGGGVTATGAYLAMSRIKRDLTFRRVR